jgi:hypothetical protein
MACQITATNLDVKVHPFSQRNPPRPGGDAFGTVCFTATCDDGTPEDEPISRFFSWLLDRNIYDRSGYSAETPRTISCPKPLLRTCKGGSEPLGSLRFGCA